MWQFQSSDLVPTDKTVSGSLNSLHENTLVCCRVAVDSVSFFLLPDICLYSKPCCRECSCIALDQICVRKSSEKSDQGFSQTPPFAGAASELRSMSWHLPELCCSYVCAQPSFAHPQPLTHPPRWVLSSSLWMSCGFALGCGYSQSLPRSLPYSPCPSAPCPLTPQLPAHLPWQDSCYYHKKPQNLNIY